MWSVNSGLISALLVYTMINSVKQIYKDDLHENLVVAVYFQKCCINAKEIIVIFI